MQVSCLPPLEWDVELAEVAQVWADQCAMIIYPGGRGFPRIFHEKSSQRTTSRFQHPPGVGQNVAWALTEGVNFTQIIDDLWYRDIRYIAKKHPNYHGTKMGFLEIWSPA